ncbi:MAG: HAD-IIB family hydrolase [Microbacteriaceae bacterium]|jgi:hypothetical protein|nr:HAD-IIB family hydrolase [Microbacteriaceae bacterium]HPZ35515.1 HAD-IIB family hydrolase [Microbacteriaceae bacterium]HQC93321.1 HAD-IIB family hydrolase [Microbacteriaceae bacterium]
MTTPPRLVAFDLDDTLAPSKTAVSERMGALLLALAERVPVCIISGGQVQQFRAQVLERLVDASPAALAALHLMPTCGTQYYRVDADASLQTVYAHSLSDEEKSRAFAAVEAQARRLGLWAENPWGDILEDRGSQITFSALGQNAPLEAKHAWDPTSEKKSALRAAVAEVLPDLEVRSGGSTSVDITHRGIDKAYGMQKLAEHSGIALDEMLFFGDRLDPDGNDYPVLALGVPCVAVEGWEHTAALLEALIPTLPGASE